MPANGLTVSRLEIDSSNRHFEVATWPTRASATSKEPLGHAVLVPSGAVGPWREATPAAEAWVELANKLSEYGIGVSLFDVPRRQDRSVPADSVERAERSDRLRRTIHHLECSGAPVTMLVGLSLGAETILETLSSPDAPRGLRRVVLASHVVEHPSPVMVSVGELWLIYGELDGVAYVGSEAELKAPTIEVERPERYGPRSAAQLILLPSCRRRMVILAGRRHDLSSATDPAAGPLSLVPFVVGDGESVERQSRTVRGTMLKSKENQL